MYKKHLGEKKLKEEKKNSSCRSTVTMYCKRKKQKKNQ